MGLDRALDALSAYAEGSVSPASIPASSTSPTSSGAMPSLTHTTGRPVPVAPSLNPTSSRARSYAVASDTSLGIAEQVAAAEDIIRSLPDPAMPLPASISHQPQPRAAYRPSQGLFSVAPGLAPTSSGAASRSMSDFHLPVTETIGTNQRSLFQRGSEHRSTSNMSDDDDDEVFSDDSGSESDIPGFVSRSSLPISPPRTSAPRYRNPFPTETFSFPIEAATNRLAAGTSRPRSETILVLDSRDPAFAVRQIAIPRGRGTPSSRSRFQVDAPAVTAPSANTNSHGNRQPNDGPIRAHAFEPTPRYSRRLSSPSLFGAYERYMMEEQSETLRLGSDNAENVQTRAPSRQDSQARVGTATPNTSGSSPHVTNSIFENVRAQGNTSTLGSAESSSDVSRDLFGRILPARISTGVDTSRSGSHATASAAGIVTTPALSAITTVDLEDCSICQEGISWSDRCEVQNCNHAFHTECIMEWLDTLYRRDGPNADWVCPLCRGWILQTRSEFNPRMATYKVTGIDGIYLKERGLAQGRPYRHPEARPELARAAREEWLQDAMNQNRELRRQYAEGLLNPPPPSARASVALDNNRQGLRARSSTVNDHMGGSQQARRNVRTADGSLGESQRSGEGLADLDSGSSYDGRARSPSPWRMPILRRLRSRGEHLTPGIGASGNSRRRPTTPSLSLPESASSSGADLGDGIHASRLDRGRLRTSAELGSLSRIDPSDETSNGSINRAPPSPVEGFEHLNRENLRSDHARSASSLASSFTGSEFLRRTEFLPRSERSRVNAAIANVNAAAPASDLPSTTARALSSFTHINQSASARGSAARVETPTAIMTANATRAQRMAVLDAWRKRERARNPELAARTIDLDRNVIASLGIDPTVNPTVHPTVSSTAYSIFSSNSNANDDTHGHLDSDLDEE